MGETDTSENCELIEVVCKSVTYQIRVSPGDSNSLKLTVFPNFNSGSWDVEKVRRFQEANRIRCRIMERINPNFAEQSQELYGTIQTMYLLRYCAIAIIAAFICYAAVPGIFNAVLGADSIKGIYIFGMAVVVVLVVYYGYALSPYITVTRSEKLLDGIPVPQYLNNDALMELLQNKLHLRTMNSLYFDENGNVAIRGKSATYLVKISPENPRLSVIIQGSNDAEAYQEANYIQCSIAKLFNSAYAENPEKMYDMLLKLHRGNLITGISVLALIALFVVPFLLNYFGSNGIANSYLTQYSETVTVGEAFEAFFSNPKWDSYKIGGQEYVDFTGGCTYMGEDSTMRITFAVFDKSFRVDNIAVNGVDMPVLLWPGFLTVIYSGEQPAKVLSSIKTQKVLNISGEKGCTKPSPPKVD